MTDLPSTDLSALLERVEKVAAALRDKSFGLDRDWHDPNGSYGTKPRALLDEAASLLSALIASEGGSGPEAQ